MNKKIEIYIACGSGIATSTVVQEKVKQILAQSIIQASITKGNINQIPSKAETVDLILVTTRYVKPVKVPILPVFSLISGINEEQTAQKIVEECHRIIKGG